MIRAVLIDIDDTLLDFGAFVREAMAEGFPRFGLPPFEEGMLPVFHAVNGRLWREIEDGTMTIAQLRERRWNAIFSALGVSGDGAAFEDFFRSRLYDSAIPVEGAADALDYLRGRYILCAASNGPYAQQLHRLEIAGMAGYFRHCFISERLGAPKPTREFFARCFAALNAGLEAPIRPEEALMLGDSVSSDMAGAIGFGMKSCHFDRAGTGCALPVDAAIHTLREIRTIL